MLIHIAVKKVLLKNLPLPLKPEINSCLDAAY